MTMAAIRNDANNIDERWWDDESSCWGRWDDATLLPPEAQIDIALPEGGRYVPSPLAGVIAKADEERHDAEVAAAKRAVETLESDYSLCAEITAYVEGALRERFYIWQDYFLSYVPGSSDTEFTDNPPRRLLCVAVGLNLDANETFDVDAWVTVRRASAADGPLAAGEWELEWKGPFPAAAIAIDFSTTGSDLQNAQCLLDAIYEWRYPG